jgi:hypothetical protein
VLLGSRLCPPPEPLVVLLFLLWIAKRLPRGRQFFKHLPPKSIPSTGVDYPHGCDSTLRGRLYFDGVRLKELQTQQRVVIGSPAVTRDSKPLCVWVEGVFHGGLLSLKSLGSAIIDDNGRREVPPQTHNVEPRACLSRTVRFSITASSCCTTPRSELSMICSAVRYTASDGMPGVAVNHN